MKRALILMGLLAVAACASTPQADLAATEVSLTQLENAAYNYATVLPLCGTEQPGQLCRTLATEAVIKKAVVVAEAALSAAQANVTAGTVANFQTAVSALSAIIPAGVAAATTEQTK